MLKKLIILLGILAIENSINCAEVQNAIGANYITQVTEADLAQIAPDDICAICQDLLGDRGNL